MYVFKHRYDFTNMKQHSRIDRKIKQLGKGPHVESTRIPFPTQPELSLYQNHKIYFHLKSQVEWKQRSQ